MRMAPTLLARIKEGRGREASPQPWPQTAWAAVAALVVAYDLKSLAQFQELVRTDAPAVVRDRLSLFPLVDAAQYALVQAIVAQYDNPYLPYARTPGEIVLSQRLYKRNPDMDPALLARIPLASLWEGMG
jgi:uncharacterized protein YqhQ